MASAYTTQNKSGSEGTKDSPAIWFFVGAIFVTLLPTFGGQLNIEINPVLSWIAGAGLTAIGFWAMFQKSGKSHTKCKPQGY